MGKAGALNHISPLMGTNRPEWMLMVDQDQRSGIRGLCQSSTHRLLDSGKVHQAPRAGAGFWVAEGPGWIEGQAGLRTVIVLQPVETKHNRGPCARWLGDLVG